MEVIRQLVRFNSNKTWFYTIDGTPKCLDIYSIELFRERVVKFAIVEFPEFPTPTDMVFEESGLALVRTKADATNGIQAN